MEVKKYRPRIFVGSSTEQLHIAKAIQANLEPDIEVTIWNQGIFSLSRTTLESLIDQLPVTDAAVFVFGPDDITTLRGSELESTRDNVVFELGLFLGVLGRDKCFFVVPHGTEDLRIPTDLAGVTYGKYTPNRSDENYQAAVGPACNQIVQELSDRNEQVDRIKTYNSFQSQLIPWGDLFNSASRADILFMGSGTWRSHHFLRLQRFCSRSDTKLCVLLPDPADHALASHLTTRWGGDSEMTKKRIDSALSFFEELKTSSQSASLQVFAISRPPLFSFFRFGDRALMCFYSHRRRLVGVPTLLCHRQDYTFRYAVNEFNHLLNQAIEKDKKLI